MNCVIIFYFGDLKRTRFRGFLRRTHLKNRTIWEWEPWIRPELGAKERIMVESDGSASTNVGGVSAEEGIIVDLEGDWGPSELLGDVGSHEIVGRWD